MVIIQPGTAQWAVYSHHFDHPPIAAKHGGRGKKLDRRNQIGMQLTNLRLAATCPHHEGLAEVITGVNGGTARSWTDANPKQAAILSLCADLLDRGEQVLVGSPFRSFNRSLHARLAEAGVACVLLDGQTSQERRGELAGQFKEHRFSVAVAGLDAMAEGHSFAQCAHLIQPSFSFCLDVNAQFPDRIWRLDSPRPVTIYTMVTRGTVDEAVLALYKDKLGSSQLALDGQLTEETIEQVDLAALLEEVVRNFDPQQATVDEQDIEAQWPALKRRLGYAEVRYREFHPPIIGTLVNSTDVTGAVNALAAPSPSPMAVHLARIRAKRGRVRH